MTWQGSPALGQHARLACVCGSGGRWGVLTCKASLHLDLLDVRVSWMEPFKETLSPSRSSFALAMTTMSTATIIIAVTIWAQNNARLACAARVSHTLSPPSHHLRAKPSAPLSETFCGWLKGSP